MQSVRCYETIPKFAIELLRARSMSIFVVMMSPPSMMIIM